MNLKNKKKKNLKERKRKLNSLKFRNKSVKFTYSYASVGMRSERVNERESRRNTKKIYWKNPAVSF